MAKAATKTVADKKKKKKAAAKPVAARSGAAKPAKPAKPAKKGKSRAAPKAERNSNFDSLVKLADHPLLADLLAAGALAAVAAIAEHQLSDKRSTSSKVVKTAGKAAAAAIGKKLMGEIGAVAGAATKAAKNA